MKLEKILICLFLIGLGFRLFNIPSGPFLMVVAGCSLSLFYLVAGYFLFRDSESKQRKNGLSILAGIALGIAPMALLFRLQNWEGNRFLLLEAVAAAAAVLVGTLYMMRKPDPLLENYYKSLLLRAGLWAAVCLTGLVA